LNAVWLGSSGSGEINIIGSTLVANNDVTSPAGITTPILNDYNATGMKITVQGSELYAVSHRGSAPASSTGSIRGRGRAVPVILRASSIRSVGTGGTRADIYNDSGAANVNVGATETPRSRVITERRTADSRQGQYSSDLIVPLTSPTLGPVNGRSGSIRERTALLSIGGTTRCILGS